MVLRKDEVGFYWEEDDEMVRRIVPGETVELEHTVEIEVVTETIH